MDNSHLEELISELTYRIEELETKVETINSQINKAKYGDTMVETVEKLKKKISDIDDLESRISDLENP